MRVWYWVTSEIIDFMIVLNCSGLDSFVNFRWYSRKSLNTLRNLEWWRSISESSRRAIRNEEHGSITNPIPPEISGQCAEPVVFLPIFVVESMEDDRWTLLWSPAGDPLMCVQSPVNIDIDIDTCLSKELLKLLWSHIIILFGLFSLSILIWFFSSSNKTYYSRYVSSFHSNFIGGCNLLLRVSALTDWFHSIVHTFN